MQNVVFYEVFLSSYETTNLDPIPNTYINDTITLNHLIYLIYLKFGGFQK